MATQSGSVRGVRWNTVAAASGACFSVVALVAFLIALGPSDTSGPGVFAYYARHDSAVRWQALLFGLAAILLLWFAGSVAGMARASGSDAGGRHGGILLAAAGASVALYFVGVGAWLTLAVAFGGATASAPDVAASGDAYTLWTISDSSFSLSNFPAAALVGTAALVLSQARQTRAGLAWLGGGVAAFLALNGCIQVLSDSDFASALGTIAFLLFLAWIFLASALLTFAAQRGVTAAA